METKQKLLKNRVAKNERSARSTFGELFRKGDTVRILQDGQEAIIRGFLFDAVKTRVLALTSKGDCYLDDLDKI